MISKPSASSIKNLLVRLAVDENGTEVVEMVLVVALIAVASILALKAVGVNVALRWSDISDMF